MAIVALDGTLGVHKISVTLTHAVVSLLYSHGKRHLRRRVSVKLLHVAWVRCPTLHCNKLMLKMLFMSRWQSWPLFPALLYWRLFSSGRSSGCYFDTPCPLLYWSTNYHLTDFLSLLCSRYIQLSLSVLLFGVGVATVTDLQLNAMGSVLSLLAIVTTCIAQIVSFWQ